MVQYANNINKMNCELMLTYDTSALRQKCAYMFNVYRNQRSRQTGSSNLTGPKTLPTIWYTYMMLVTKYQISAINSCWEKCDEKYLGRTEGKTVYLLPPSGSGGITKRTTIYYFKSWNTKYLWIRFGQAKMWWGLSG